MKMQTAATTESTFSSADLAERVLHRRAVEAVIWGIPAVNFDLMFQALVRFYGPEKPLFDKTWVLPDIEKVS